MDKWKLLSRLIFSGARVVALLTTLIATSGCVVPQSLPTLHIRGKVIDGETGEAVAYARVTVKWQQYGSGKPHMTYGPVDSDLDGGFSFIIPSQIKMRELVGSYHNFPDVDAHHATRGEDSIMPAYFETKNPYVAPVVLRLIKGPFYKPQIK